MFDTHADPGTISTWWMPRERFRRTPASLRTSDLLRYSMVGTTPGGQHRKIGAVRRLLKRSGARKTLGMKLNLSMFLQGPLLFGAGEFQHSEYDQIKILF